MILFWCIVANHESKLQIRVWPHCKSIIELVIIFILIPVIYIIPPRCGEVCVVIRVVILIGARVRGCGVVVEPVGVVLTEGITVCILTQGITVCILTQGITVCILTDWVIVVRGRRLVLGCWRVGLTGLTGLTGTVR